MPSFEDRSSWNDKYRAEQEHQRRVNPTLVRLAPQLTVGRALDLAGGFGQNGAWLARFDPRFRVVNADLSDVGLARATPAAARVLADAGALPFPPATFETVLCFRFFDARVRFADLLAPGGTVLFQTYTLADAKYRPDFNPAHRFDLAALPTIFRDLELLDVTETDDGHRVFATILARAA